MGNNLPLCVTPWVQKTSLSALRTPPQLMGIIPQNTGGFSDVEKAVKVFFRNELTPLQSKILQINDWLGEEVIKLDKYTIDDE